MRASNHNRRVPSPDLDCHLSPEQHRALQQACAPAGSLTFPPSEVIRALRSYGYIEIVLGGVQITPSGLERLLWERRRARANG